MTAKTTSKSQTVDYAELARQRGLNPVLKATNQGSRDGIFLGVRECTNAKGPFKVIEFVDGCTVVVPRNRAIPEDFVAGDHIAAYWDDGIFHLDRLS